MQWENSDEERVERLYEKTKNCLHSFGGGFLNGLTAPGYFMESKLRGKKVNENPVTIGGKVFKNSIEKIPEREPGQYLPNLELCSSLLGVVAGGTAALASPYFSAWLADLGVDGYRLYREEKFRANYLK